MNQNQKTRFLDRERPDNETLEGSFYLLCITYTKAVRDSYFPRKFLKYDRYLEIKYPKGTYFLVALVEAFTSQINNDTQTIIQGVLDSIIFDNAQINTNLNDTIYVTDTKLESQSYLPMLTILAGKATYNDGFLKKVFDKILSTQSTNIIDKLCILVKTILENDFQITLPINTLYNLVSQDEWHNNTCYVKLVSILTPICFSDLYEVRIITKELRYIDNSIKVAITDFILARIKQLRKCKEDNVELIEIVNVIKNTKYDEILLQNIFKTKCYTLLKQLSKEELYPNLETYFREHFKCNSLFITGTDWQIITWALDHKIYSKDIKSRIDREIVVSLCLFFIPSVLTLTSVLVNQFEFNGTNNQSKRLGFGLGIGSATPLLVNVVRFLVLPLWSWPSFADLWNMSKEIKQGLKKIDQGLSNNISPGENVMHIIKNGLLCCYR